MAEKEKQEKNNKNQEENTNQQEEKNNQTESNEGGRGVNVNYALIGGVVGAGVGLLSHPGTGKKLAGSLGKSEVVRMAGNELRRTAQEFITEQALITLRQTAAGYMGKYENGMLPFTKKKEEASAQEEQEETSSSVQNDEIEEIKEENKNLNERLERIEEMLSSLVESKK
ncbi:GvpT/GvpP family gas vesicle accessory protein [[Bacillus] enclensis]|jgi:gas vesicle protein|uniref:GvpT/GvpP family gas vesicle accessory protein n=1 Tax=[Bacillus] enclensis TaxID=1402860 RepID=UPI0018DC73D0|nr:GvpT/GvpP family gas vesicle accessory protein [[Bacillus] enclensis]MBH9966819.1 gas vesicle protein GvpP [[Bacillus] enclensis]